MTSIKKKIKKKILNGSGWPSVLLFKQVAVVVGDMTIYVPFTKTELPDGSLVPDAAQEAVLPELTASGSALMAPQKKGFFQSRTRTATGVPLPLGGVGRGQVKCSWICSQRYARWAYAAHVHFHAFHAGNSQRDARGPGKTVWMIYCTRCGRGSRRQM